MKNEETRLFQESRIGNLILKNRFIRSSMGDHTPGGRITQAVLDKYRAQAMGGVSTVITGFTLVDEAEKDADIARIYDDSFIPENKALVDTIHSAGANAIMQLVYLGSNFRSKVLPEHVLSASDVPDPYTGVIPEPMTKDDIKRVINSFVKAAVRAKEAGYDGVEIHACHGYLLNQFATPAQNHRTDEYGGSRKNRYRITIEVYEAIRKAVGDDYQVWIKVMSQDGFPGGVDNDDCAYLCNELAARGIDAIEVSGNFFRMKGETAFFEEAANRIAQETKKPVIVTGGNRDYHEMEHMIETTDIDYVGLARPLIAHPDFVNQMYNEFVK